MLTAPGSMLTPNLRLLRLLGRGGMGSVWLAEHLVLGSEVAVKLLSPELARDEEALERFQREATAVAQLRSPHVVGIHDFGAGPDGVPFFVMERLLGEDLSQRLERAHRLPIGIVTAILVQTCKALARVHEVGIVHRDLKPGNIFLTNVDGDLVVKLLDFGVAKTRSATTRLHETSDQAVLGTPMYMSPEQILSPKNVGPSSDLYSLAVVVYECLTGKPPFEGETAGALHVAIVNGRYAPVTSIDPSLPAALDGWFARALANEPGARFGSAREMADAFLVASRSRPFALGASPRARTTTSSQPLLPSMLPSSPSMPGATMPQATMPQARPASSAGAVAPFGAGVLAVLVLLAAIVGATRLTKRDSTTPAGLAGSTSSVAAAPTAAPPAPAKEASSASEADDGAAWTVEIDDAPAAAPSSIASATAKPAATALQVPPPKSTSTSTPRSTTRPSPRRKNRGF